MTPTSFEFTVTMPRDGRLVAAIRGLAAHAAGYARLSDAAGEALATQVARAADAAVAGPGGEHAPIDVRFTGGDDMLTVVISYEAGAAPAPAPSGGPVESVTVDWASEQSRHICRIRQRIGS